MHLKKHACGWPDATKTMQLMRFKVRESDYNLLKNKIK